MEKFIRENSEKLIEITQEILRIRSVEETPYEAAPFGFGVKNALEKALKISEDLGFKAVNLGNVLGFAEYGEGSEVISVLGHLDVVPEGKGWDYPPYGAEIHDGKIYARGAIDDKGPTMASLFGLYAIKEVGLPLSKKVRIIFGTNEETGWKCMDYLKENIKDKLVGFAPDGKFPVINREKGILNVTLRKDFNIPNTEIIIKGGERPNMVPDYAEANFLKGVSGILDISSVEIKDNIIMAKGTSAHASLPEKGKNAIVILSDALKKVKLSSEVGEVIDFINKYIGTDYNGSSIGIGYEDLQSGKLTINLGIIDVEENYAELTFNIRYPVTVNSKEVIEGIKSKIVETNFYIKDYKDQKPLFVNENSELVKTLLSVYSRKTGLEPFTLSIGGGTYARAMDVGVAFGPTFIGQEEVEHMANEYIDIEHLINLAKIYGEAIYELAK